MPAHPKAPEGADAAAWETLSRAMSELRALAGVSGLLGWDQETYMPPKASAARGEQVAAIEGAIHDRLASAEVRGALERLEAHPPEDADRAAAVRELSRDHAQAAAVPGALVRAIARAQSEGLEAWRVARQGEGFGRFAPALSRLLELRREQAAALLPVLGRPGGGPAPEPYDALLDLSEPGLRVVALEPLLRGLCAWLVPLLDRITARPPPDDSFLHGTFDGEAQWRFTLELLDLMGFDREAGRQDRSVHPFTVGLDPSDVRITTRIHEHLPLSAAFSTLHEAGHGLYEQQLPAALRQTVLCAAASNGLHESQSRLWENQVGRSLPFWRVALPRMARHLPQLSGVSPERFFRAVNRVERSLVRVEADEVTYNLHIVLRFELELLLLRGKLEVRDLPAAWDERSERLLGIRPPGEVEGVLQDIHWAWGAFGYFPSYTVGNLYAASLFAAARRALPGLEGAIERGELSGLKEWLGRNVHAVGRRRQAEEIVRAVTGQGLTDRDLREYLERKYLGELA
ncbi:MAG TPA: carboxypeptidase M32 [Anaeromyxobacter sp.]|nr:carboxypeptidase M32 [Anaeromyxobacter sp.]